MFLSLTGHRTEEDEAEDDGRRPQPEAAAEEAPDRQLEAGACPSPQGSSHDHRRRHRTDRPGAPHPPGVASATLRWLVSDTPTLTRRNLLAVTRIPEALFFSTIQPIMFVLLFRYVFGGAIHTDATSYVNYLMPGIFVQTVAFGAVSTSIGLAEDLQKGLIERFRALPMSRGAVLLGRTTADLIRNIFVIVIMTVVGLLVGFRPTTGVALLHRRRPADPALRLRPVLGVRHRRPVGPQQRDGPGHVVPADLPAHVHLARRSSPSAACRAGSRGSPPTSRSA